jgi:hypothetical protein
LLFTTNWQLMQTHDRIKRIEPLHIHYNEPSMLSDSKFLLLFWFFVVIIYIWHGDFVGVHVCKDCRKLMIDNLSYHYFTVNGFLHMFIITYLASVATLFNSRWPCWWLPKFPSAKPPFFLSFWGRQNAGSLNTEHKHVFPFCKLRGILSAGGLVRYMLCEPWFDNKQSVCVPTSFMAQRWRT